MESFEKEIREELEDHILSYWMTKMQDKEQGGFYGQIDGQEILHPAADKGVVLNARILWTFSAAYRLLGKIEYLEMAKRARNYLLTYFYDFEYHGFYWSVKAEGTPQDTKKQTYAQGFVIYGLTEYFRATGDTIALDYAIETFECLEKYVYDLLYLGYVEALDRMWQPLPDVRLSEKDVNEKKTTNTHLHVLEAYTNLYRVWESDLLRVRLGELIRIFLDKVLDTSTFHLNLFFDECWINKKHIISYGHEIEAVWLLYEAAVVLNDVKLLKEVKKVIPRIAEAAAEGLQGDGSLIYEIEPDGNRWDKARHWWVQAEGIVGFFNDYQLTGNPDSLIRVKCLWRYITDHLVDREHGEWFWSVSASGEVNRKDDKAGFWKCPYHNARMCMEVLIRMNKERTV